MAVVINGTTGITAPTFDGAVEATSVQSDTYLDASGGNTATINGIPLRPGVLDPENRVINGAFDIWQRGTSQTTSGYGSADRWLAIFVGGSCTQSRQSFTLGETLGSNNPRFFLRQTVSGQTLPSHLAAISQRIEGVRSYAGQTITVLGWARRVSGAGDMAVEFSQNFGTGGSPSGVVNNIGVSKIPLTSAWTPFAVTATIPSITGKTIGANNDDFFVLFFWTSAGSDYNTRTNSLGLQTIGVDLWGIHIKVGTHTADATSLYRQPELGPELARCQRYYCSTIANARFPAAAAAQIVNVSVYWPVQMRATPSCARSGSSNNTSLIAFSLGADAGVGGARFEIKSAAAGDCYAIDNIITADAEL